MKLIEQIMRKKLELSEESRINKNHLRELSYLYCCLQIANGLMKHLGKGDLLTEDEIDYRNHLWKKILSDPKTIDENALKKLEETAKEDLSKIFVCFEAIEEKKEEGGDEFGDIFLEDTIGVLEYEYPEEFE